MSLLKKKGLEADQLPRRGHEKRTPRLLAQRLVNHPDFHLLITCLIFADTVVIALYDPALADSVGRNTTLWAIGAYTMSETVHT